MATISNNDIATAIYENGKNKTGADLRAFSQNVVRFLARKRLLSKAEDILEKIENINNVKHSVIKVKVKSAKKLATETKHHLSTALHKRYKAKDVIWDEAVDEKLLGGLKIEVNDEVIDLTLKNKAEKLQEYLTRSI